MTLLTPHPTTSRSWQPTLAGTGQEAAPSAGGGLLQFQLRLLIGEILAQPDLDPVVRGSLLGHLAVTPGHPEQALLAHLHAILGPEDLPNT